MYEVLSRRFRRAREADGGERRATRWQLPDLMVIDGGKGQLGMALAAARDVGIDVRPGIGLPIVGLAKERERGGRRPRRRREVARRRRREPRSPDDRREAATAPRAAEPPAAPSRPRPARGRGGRRRQGRRRKKPDRVFLPHAKDAIPIRPTAPRCSCCSTLRDEAHRFAVSFHRGQRRRLTLRSALSDIPGIGPGRQRQLLRHFGSMKSIREASVDDLAAVPGISRSVAEAVFAHWASSRSTRRSPGRSRNSRNDAGSRPRSTPSTTLRGGRGRVGAPDVQDA